MESILLTKSLTINHEDLEHSFRGYRIQEGASCQREMGSFMAWIYRPGNEGTQEEVDASDDTQSAEAPHNDDQPHASMEQRTHDKVSPDERHGKHH